MSTDLAEKPEETEKTQQTLPQSALDALDAFEAKQNEGTETAQEETEEVQEEQPEAEAPVTEETEETKETTPAEAVADDEPGGEEETETPDTPEWLDEHTVALAQSYGLADEDVANYQSREELERAMLLVDAQFARAGQAALQEEQPPQQAPPQQPAQQQTDAATAASHTTLEIDPEKFREAGADDETVKLAETVVALNKQLSQLSQASQTQQQTAERAQQEVDRQQFVDDFHKTLDRVNPDRFGNSEKDMTYIHHAAREQVWNQALVIASGMAANGVEIPTNEVIVQRAEQFAFMKENEALRQKQRAQKVRKQSATRLGSSSSRRRSKTTEDTAIPMDQDPELREFFDSALKDNGQA